MQRSGIGSGNETRQGVGPLCWPASAIDHSLSMVERETRARMGRKFELCFVMEESIPFAKYPTLLQLEEHHGVDVGSAYRTPDSAKSFTGSIYY